MNLILQMQSHHNTSDYKQSLLSEHPHQVLITSPENRFDDLTQLKFWAYGMGHFINDLASTCWFNYLLFFLSEVVGTPAAPWAMLSGQIADGIATPIVGHLSDKTKTRFGQRKPWYVGGLILVVCTFLPTFQNYRKWFGNTEQTGGQLAYYIIFPSLFNVGWAALQISHMSLVPSLTCSRKRRDRLNNLRNSFTFISNFSVLAIALILFATMSNNSLEFTLLSIIVVVLGVGASIFFLIVIDQVKLAEACKMKAENLRHFLEQQKKGSRNTIESGEATEFSEDDQLNIVRSKKTYKVARLSDWFKLPAFYIFGFCYMGVRLYSNLFGSLLSFYLLYVLGLGGGNNNPNSIPFIVALIPLLIYLSSVLTSFGLSKFYSKFGRKTALMTGGVLCVVNAICMVFLSSSVSWPIYVLAFPIGIAQSMVLATGINMISEVIGTKGQQGAFVFGIYSLLDKFSAGIAIFFITNSTLFQNHNSDFIRYMTVVVPSAACVCACLIVFFTPIQEYSKKKQDKRRKSSLEEELVV